MTFIFDGQGGFMIDAYNYSLASKEELANRCMKSDYDCDKFRRENAELKSKLAEAVTALETIETMHDYACDPEVYGCVCAERKLAGEVLQKLRHSGGNEEGKP